MTPTRSHPEFPDSDSADRGRGFRAMMARIFGDAEHPLSWSIPAGSIAGIRIRIHILFMVYAVAQMLWSINKDFFGPGYTAIAMAVLFTIVLLHEFGHCLACRMVGGDADEILMWPLGGLASCHPPNNWRAHLVTTVGGPAVNVAILPITSLALWAAGRPQTILFNPFNLGVFYELNSWWLVTLWLLHAVNLLILAFNVLLPIFPLDGGRIMQALLWRSVGRRQSMETSTFVGLIAAGVLAVFALVADTVLVLGVALFCALVCWSERQRMRAPEVLGSDFDLFDEDMDDQTREREARQSARRHKRDAEEQQELDRVLAKIANSGMDSLTGREKRTLRRATSKKRQDG